MPGNNLKPGFSFILKNTYKYKKGKETHDTILPYILSNLTVKAFHLSSLLSSFFLAPSLLPSSALTFPALRCHLDFLADHGLLSSASLTSVILFTLPFLSNWSNFPPWLWWMCPALPPCPSTLVGLIKENIPWLPIFPRAWQPIILPSTWLESYYA